MKEIIVKIIFGCDINRNLKPMDSGKIFFWRQNENVELDL